MNRSGTYELLLRFSAEALEDGGCAADAGNVSVVVRTSAGYSHTRLDVAEANHPPDSGAVALGNFTIVAGATAFVTVDVTYATAGVDAKAAVSCVALENVALRLVGPVTAGCTDDKAENYDPFVGEDDGSCVYLISSMLANTTSHFRPSFFPSLSFCGFRS